MKERLSLTPGTPRFTARSNRILSKVQKSFWSCTHVNSCQKIYIIYQSTCFIEYFIQNNSNIQESRKSIKFLKR